MGYENDPYRDEDDEPLMDPDMTFDQEPEDNEEDWRDEREPTPVHNYDPDKVGKPRKRLIKKSTRDDFDVGGDEAAMNFVRDDFENDDNDQMYTNSKRKSSSGAGGSGKKEKKMKSSERRIEKGGGFKNSSRSAGGSSGKSNSRVNNGVDPELERDMWNTVAGGNSEDDQEGVRNMDDENFIDDTGVDPADRYGSDNERYVHDAPQAEEGEEDDEVDRLFKGGKKKKKPEKSAAEMALVVEHLMAELELTAENDADLNLANKPAVEKLKKLPLLTEVLSKKQFQLEFLDRGVLTLLKNWLEPLPDGSLPNINIRTAILKILTDFPIDLEQYDRREQLKKSGLGKVIMFLSRSDEETTGNRRLAKDLVDKWSRPIFNKSTRFEDMKHNEDDRVPYRRPPVKKRMDIAATLDSRDDDLDDFSRERKSSESSSRQHASRPEAAPLDFMVRPQSKIDPDEIRARAKQVVHDQRRVKMNKKLQQLKAPKKKMLQASKLSVEGRGMVKFF